jgi:hypothetical protein
MGQNIHAAIIKIYYPFAKQHTHAEQTKRNEVQR